MFPALSVVRYSPLFDSPASAGPCEPCQTMTVLPARLLVVPPNSVSVCRCPEDPEIHPLRHPLGRPAIGTCCCPQSLGLVWSGNWLGKLLWRLKITCSSFGRRSTIIRLSYNHQLSSIPAEGIRLSGLEWLAGIWFLIKGDFLWPL